MNESRTKERVPLRAAAQSAAEADPPAAPAAESATRRALPHGLRSGAPAWVWVSMGVCLLGFVLIAVGWGQVAGENQVHLQLPYVVSASLAGLTLVIVGVTVLNIATRERDGLDRDRQIAHLISIIEELRETLAERGPR